MEHFFLSYKELNHPQLEPQKEEYFLEIMGSGLEEYTKISSRNKTK